MHPFGYECLILDVLSLIIFHNRNIFKHKIHAQPIFLRFFIIRAPFVRFRGALPARIEPSEPSGRRKIV